MRVDPFHEPEGVPGWAPDWEPLNRFLHDELAQLLSLALIHLDQAQDTPSAARQARRLVQQSLCSTRDWLNRLQSPRDATGSLALALHDRARRVEARHDREVRFVQDGDPLPVLPDAVTGALLDATQELLTNACRHARTDTPVEARLLMRGHGLTITVCDAGAGLAALASSAPGTRGGLGLHLARQRLQSVGASLRWRGGSRSGVQARIRWCPPQRPAAASAAGARP